MKISSTLAQFALSCVVLAPWCQGSVLITAIESGSDVIASGSGTINTAALSSGSSAGGQGFLRGQSVFAFNVGSGSATSVQLWSSILGPSSIGPSSAFHIASSGTGSVFGVNGNFVQLPASYVSGSSLVGTSTYTGQTFASLGLTQGSYTWTWGSGGTADSLTLNIGAVPEPSETLAVAGVVCLGAALLRRWQRSR